MALFVNWFVLSLVGCFVLSTSGGILYENGVYRNNQGTRIRDGGERNAVIVEVPANLVNARVNGGNGNIRGGTVNRDILRDFGVSLSPAAGRHRSSRSGSATASGGGNGIGSIIKITTVASAGDAARYKLAGAYHVNNREGVRHLLPVPVIPISNRGSTGGRSAEPRAARGDVSSIRIINLSGGNDNSGSPGGGTVVDDLHEGNRGTVQGDSRDTNPIPLPLLQNVVNGGIGVSYNVGPGGNAVGGPKIIRIVAIGEDRGHRGGTQIASIGTFSSAGGYRESTSVNSDGGSSGATGTGGRSSSGNLPIIRISLPDTDGGADGARVISGTGREGVINGNKKSPADGTPFIRITLTDSAISGNNLRIGYEGGNVYRDLNDSSGRVKYVYKL